MQTFELQHPRGSESSPRCAKCGAPLSAFKVGGKPENQCPECLFGLGLAEPVSVLSSGSSFGAYVLGRQLGRGAMGVVYEAVHFNLKRKVALKMILDANLTKRVLQWRFRIEAETAARLNHPNIIPLYDFGEHDGQPFITMQLICGENLKEKILRGELCLLNQSNDAKTIASFMAKVARAVGHAHQNNVLHRDLKPANILVDTEGEPHLTDFGLAQILEEPTVGEAETTLTDAVVGTPSYMAPEHARGGESTRATDIYSLGAILYEMLSGQPPFKGSTAVETLRQANENEPVKPRMLVQSVPTDLQTICLKCLDKNAGHRYASADALAEDLERWLEAKPIRAAMPPAKTIAIPAGPVQQLRRWWKRNPEGATLIILLCFAARYSVLNYALEQRGRPIQMGPKSPGLKGLPLAIEADGNPIRGAIDSQFAHQRVIQAVVNGEFDVGVCRSPHLERVLRPSEREQLVVVASFQVSPKVYVTRAGLNSPISVAFRNALTGYPTSEEKEILRRWFDKCEGFKAIDDTDLQDVRAALENDIPFFETGRRPDTRVSLALPR